MSYAGEQGEKLLCAVTALYEELGKQASAIELETILSAVEATGAPAFGAMLEANENELVTSIGLCLARIATAVGDNSSGGIAPAPNAVVATLAGAQMLMRTELVAGRIDQLPRLLPGFVYTVTLGLVGHDEALRLSNRIEELLETSA